MKTIHVSDYDIQQFTFDLSECEAEVVKHINSCEICKRRVEEYQLLSNTIKSQPDPIFEFNLSDQVLEQLEISPEKESTYGYFIYVLIVLSIGVVTSCLFYFKEIFIDLFKSTAAISTYLIISVTVLISLVMVFDMFRSFNKKIDLLNY
ncbi:hypothetical protein [Aquimarina sp. 2201CG5-10]|uniref:hypothetical protein n=1 Tax=Aquimarina callyspongiae TaxID=3098150 RepID=UPI002AB4F5BD|nr:hypothetical protein [Aquimarina sp. 2201CG5-10]MDY8137058.1 hypothetical protein [Aquimarina sp. 2201CG5-10]